MQLALLIVGVLLVCAGIAWVFLPGALIFAGLALTLFALFWDFDRSDQ